MAAGLCRGQQLIEAAQGRTSEGTAKRMARRKPSTEAWLRACTPRGG